MELNEFSNPKLPSAISLCYDTEIKPHSWHTKELSTHALWACIQGLVVILRPLPMRNSIKLLEEENSHPGLPAVLILLCPNEHSQCPQKAAEEKRECQLSGTQLWLSILCETTYLCIPPELKWGPKPPSLLKHFRDLLSHCIHLLDWVTIERENGNKMQQHPVVTSKKPRISPASIHTTCNWFLGKYNSIRAPVPTPGMQKWSQALVWRSPQKMHTHLCSAGRCSAALCALQCELLMIREHPPAGRWGGKHRVTWARASGRMGWAIPIS